jgi:hypothetical protein
VDEWEFLRYLGSKREDKLSSFGFDDFEKLSFGGGFGFP